MSLPKDSPSSHGCPACGRHYGITSDEIERLTAKIERLEREHEYTGTADALNRMKRLEGIKDAARLADNATSWESHNRHMRRVRTALYEYDALAEQKNTNDSGQEDVRWGFNEYGIKTPYPNQKDSDN